MQFTWWQWEGIPFTETPPCRREDKGHRPQGFVRPRTPAERRETGWPGAAAHCTWPRATLGKACPDSTLCSGPMWGCVWTPRPQGPGRLGGWASGTPCLLSDAGKENACCPGSFRPLPLEHRPGRRHLRGYLGQCAPNWTTTRWWVMKLG